MDSLTDIADVRDAAVCADTRCGHPRLDHWESGRCVIEEIAHHYSPLGGNGLDDTVEDCRCGGYQEVAR